MGDQKSLFCMISRGFFSFKFPEVLSPGSREVVMMLCRVVPSRRPSLETIVKFMWFVDLDWEALRKGHLEPRLSQKLFKKQVSMKDPLTLKISSAFLSVICVLLCWNNVY